MLSVGGKISNLNELLTFEKGLGISSTVFIAVAKGMRLSYSNRSAQKIIEVVRTYGFGMGIHGQEFNNPDKMKIEMDRFKSLSGLNSFGIRNHYLRISDSTHYYMAETGYLFDSTQYGLFDVSKVNNMYIFPISIMDVSVLSQSYNNLEVVKESTLKLLKEAERRHLDYFVINFHDNYFSELYPDHKAWFIWLINLLQTKEYEFTDFYKEVKA